MQLPGARSVVALTAEGLSSPNFPPVVAPRASKSWPCLGFHAFPSLMWCACRVSIIPVVVELIGYTDVHVRCQDPQQGLPAGHLAEGEL